MKEMLDRVFTELPGVSAGFTTRMGGVSKEPYASLNLGLHVGDDAFDVMKNRQIMSEAVGTDVTSWVVAEQVHGFGVGKVRAEDMGKGSQSTDTSVLGMDALVTHVRGPVLVSLAADCVPMLFYDPSQRVIAVAHGGWRGSFAGIASQTVATMEKEYGSHPADLWVALGPHIGPCCYEVDDVVLSAARALSYPVDDWFSEGRDAQHVQCNLAAVNSTILRYSGVDPVRIVRHPDCTCCRVDRYFSHRSEGTTGRIAGLIQLI